MSTQLATRLTSLNTDIGPVTGKVLNMEYTSHSPPDSSSLSGAQKIASISIRPFGAIEKPPVTGERLMLPDVPTPRTRIDKTHGPTQFLANTSTPYTLTTHLIPAAYPRSPFPSASEPLDTSVYERIVENGDKFEREKLIVKYRESVKGWADQVNFDEYPGQGRRSDSGFSKACEEQKRVLWNSVNRLVRDPRGRNEDEDQKGRERITLFFAHANGFSKETYEPAIQHLLRQFEESNHQSQLLPPIIDEIWLFEAVQHGDSGLINTGLLPRAFDWLDNVRDIVNFLLFYIPEYVERGPAGLSIHLPRLSDDVVSRRIKEGYSYSGRKIVGIGHSLGGCSVARAAIERPNLFSSIVLVDPVIQPMPADVHAFEFGRLAEAALRRRYTWRSREECHGSFLKSAFFTSLHPDVLDAYVKYAITEDDTGVARLKMSGLHEAILFFHLRTSFETWQLLSDLDNRIPMFWIVSGLDPTTMGGPEMRQSTVWRRPANSSNVVLPVGHLIPHEAPTEFAALVWEFLIRQYSPCKNGANLGTTGDSSCLDSGSEMSLPAGYLDSVDSDAHQARVKSLL